MSACPHYRKTLWLDVYNELPDTARSKWETHLDTCDSCREEKERMVRMVATMRENLQPPPTTALSPENLIRLSRPGQASNPFTGWWRNNRFGHRLKLVPALATFGMILLAVGILSYRAFLFPAGQITGNTIPASDQIVSADAEMLKNLDLLKDMETVQRLIYVIDQTNDWQPNNNHRNNTQGKIGHGHQKTYV